MPLFGFGIRLIQSELGNVPSSSILVDLVHLSFIHPFMKSLSFFVRFFSSILMFPLLVPDSPHFNSVSCARRILLQSSSLLRLRWCSCSRQEISQTNDCYSSADHSSRRDVGEGVGEERRVPLPEGSFCLCYLGIPRKSSSCLQAYVRSL